MSGEARQTLKGLEMKELGIDEDQHWGKNRVTFECGDEACESASDESSMEDPQSSVSSPSTCGLDNKESSSNGPLYELSQLINELPIKRGLSKNYIGKSQSFTSLTKVKSIEELGKRGNSYYSYKMRMKARKSYELAVCCPKAGIEKASSKKKYVVSSLSWNDFKSHLSNHHGRASDV